MNIEHLKDHFAIAPQVEIISGPNGFPFIKINNQHASALISLYGGQVLSFKPHTEQEDLLFLSPLSLYADGKAIRGGIPVCWPWFGPDPKGLNRPNHGFVRNHYWQLAATSTDSTGQSKISLLFKETLKQENTWRQPFNLLLDVTVGKTLRLTLTTCNTGDKPFSVTQAFHSYFRVGDINAVKIMGLKGCDYYDKLQQGMLNSQTEDLVVIEEVDRIYTHVNNDLTILDKALQRRIHIRVPNTNTAVVWNPWLTTSQKMADLEDDAYRRFVCVEAGNIAFDLIQIPPNNSYTLDVEYSILPCSL